jgi:transposase-like protein
MDMASDQDDDERGEEPAGMTSAWTTLVEDAGGREPGVHLSESLRSRLIRWRDALGGAARRFRSSETAHQSPEPVRPAAPEAAETALPPLDPARMLAGIHAALARMPAKGHADLPGNHAALYRLLADQPPQVDFEAIDLLHDCFPRGTRNSDSRVLLAVARNLTRAFGRPGRLPITSGKAWTMLEAELFADELADELARIGDFILHWQASEKTFLILEFAEVELIEYLFESLDPGRHAGLLARVMDFKVLSGRRMGLLRRIPARLRRRIEAAHGAVSPLLRRHVDDTLALLDQLAGPGSFAAVANAALAAHAEVERMAAQMSSALPAPARSVEPPPLHPLMRGLAAPESLPEAASPAAAALPEPEREPELPATRPVRRRFTKAHKTEVVLRVLQGESAEAVAASVGITVKQLREWQAAFLDAGNAGLTGAQAAEPSIDDLRSRLHSLIETVELLSSQIAQIPEPDEPAGKPGRRRRKIQEG